MSTSKPSAQLPASDVPNSKRRRTLIACVDCRKRKTRCITTEQPPKNPCTRCLKRNRPCHYVSASKWDEDSDSLPAPNLPELERPDSTTPSPTSTSSSSRGSPLWNSLGFPQPESQRTRRGSLPYIVPPPVGRRPRYAEAGYPDLSAPPSPPAHYHMHLAPELYLSDHTLYPHLPTYSPYDLDAVHGSQYLSAQLALDPFSARQITALFDESFTNVVIMLSDWNSKAFKCLISGLKRHGNYFPVSAQSERSTLKTLTMMSCDCAQRDMTQSESCAPPEYVVSDSLNADEYTCPDHGYQSRKKSVVKLPSSEAN
ncbi:hypothetical protein C8R45DRAFT_1193937 [Mycena sanguinolenta]|nr:hypothetical protein C8R45DRAFT_1193937 [Mycena sanguinolenta]